MGPSNRWSQRTNHVEESACEKSKNDIEEAAVILCDTSLLSCPPRQIQAPIKSNPYLKDRAVEVQRSFKQTRGCQRSYLIKFHDGKPSCDGEGRNLKGLAGKEAKRLLR